MPDTTTTQPVGESIADATQSMPHSPTSRGGPFKALLRCVVSETLKSEEIRAKLVAWEPSERDVLTIFEPEDLKLFEGIGRYLPPQLQTLRELLTEHYVSLRQGNPFVPHDPPRNIHELRRDIYSEAVEDPFMDFLAIPTPIINGIPIADGTSQTATIREMQNAFVFDDEGDRDAFKAFMRYLRKTYPFTEQLEEEEEEPQEQQQQYQQYSEYYYNQEEQAQQQAFREYYHYTEYEAQQQQYGDYYHHDEDEEQQQEYEDYYHYNADEVQQYQDYYQNNQEEAQQHEYEEYNEEAEEEEVEIEEYNEEEEEEQGQFGNSYYYYYDGEEE